MERNELTNRSVMFEYQESCKPYSKTEKTERRVTYSPHTDDT